MNPMVDVESTVENLPMLKTASVQTCSTWPDTKEVETSTKALCKRCTNCAICRKAENIFLCEICGHRIKTRWNWEQHMNKHANKAVVGLNCPFCGKYMNMSNLGRHLGKNGYGCGRKSHQYKCPDCKLQFIDVDRFIEHLPCGVVDQECDVVGQKQVNVEEVYDFHRRLVMCPYCKMWMNGWNLGKHLRNRNKDCSHKMQQCKCSLCDLQCVDVDALVKHMCIVHSA